MLRIALREATRRDPNTKGKAGSAMARMKRRAIRGRLARPSHRDKATRLFAEAYPAGERGDDVVRDEGRAWSVPIACFSGP